MHHEMDLIPASYRERQQIQHWCHLFLIAMVVVCLAIFIGRFSISNKTEKNRLIVNKLQKDKSFNLQLQQTYNGLLTTERGLKKNLEILSGLRGGPSVRHVFTVIDRVMNGSVWFEEWSFQRAGEMTEVKPHTVQTGYFIIIEQEENNNKKQAWKLNTHMDIRGQAIDHSSFSRFVSELIKQPEIEDVKVISTNLTSYKAYQVVKFQIIVVVNNLFKVGNV